MLFEQKTLIGLEDILNRKYSSIVKGVLLIAKEAHGESIRKNTNELYLFHALRVGVALYRLNADEYVISGGILHGVLEHTSWKKEDLEKRLLKIFAPTTVLKIIAYIASVTEYFEGKLLTWSERKDIFLKRQATMPRDVLLIVFADKLDILASLAEDFKKRGAEVWQTLSVLNDMLPRKQHYTEMYYLFMRYLSAREEAGKFLKEYKNHLETLFGEAEA